MVNLGDAIVVSMSDFQRFKRCRKAADLTLARRLETVGDRPVMANGRTFHAYLEAFALSQMINEGNRFDELTLRTKLTHLNHQLQYAANDPMRVVAEQYIARRWNLAPSQIIGVELPLYTKLLPEQVVYDGGSAFPHKKTVTSPAVWLRTTFDLIYKDDDAWYVGREYKTFEKASTMDVDLDFQGKIESCVLQHHFGTTHARFEYENVRQTPPDVVKDKAGNAWTERECYDNVPLYIGDIDAHRIWAETQEVARDLVACLQSGVNSVKWYRTDLKQTYGKSPCGDCFVKELCKTEAMLGELDSQTIALSAKPRTYVPITLPDGTPVEAEKERAYIHPDATEAMLV